MTRDFSLTFSIYWKNRFFVFHKNSTYKNEKINIHTTQTHVHQKKNPFFLKTYEKKRMKNKITSEKRMEKNELVNENFGNMWKIYTKKKAKKIKVKAKIVINKN